MMKNVEGKVVIITGASSGIGKTTAKVLAENGAKVVLSARREDKLRQIAEEIGENAAYYVSDVSNLDDMKALAAFAKEKFGTIDVLFANAGIMPVGNLSQLKVEDWDRTIDIDVRGVLYAMAGVLPEFTEKKKGQIIATSSVAGTRPVPGNAVYSGSKYFVKAMMDSFRQESIAEGNRIRTTVLYPGAINTGLLGSINDAGIKSAVEDIYAKVGISPDAIANAVLYAVSQPDDVDVSDLIVRPTLES